MSTINEIFLFRIGEPHRESKKQQNIDIWEILIEWPEYYDDDYFDDSIGLTGLTGLTELIIALLFVCAYMNKWD